MMRPGPLVLEQADADRGLRGVDAHIEGGDALVHEAPESAGPEVRERHIAPVGEGEPEVIVPQPEALARTGGIPVDEAEDAFVRALADLVGLGNDAERLAGLPVDLE